MVPVAQWLERLTVDEEVEGSTPFRHPTTNKTRQANEPPKNGGFFDREITNSLVNSIRKDRKN